MRFEEICLRAERRHENWSRYEIMPALARLWAKGRAQREHLKGWKRIS